MSYLTLIIWPALLWLYGADADQHWTFDALVLGYFVAIGAVSIMMARTFQDVLVMLRGMRAEGTTPPYLPVRLACHMLAVAACMEIGVVAMVVQIAYAALYETAQEKSHDPA